jgi:hypothetical protein
MTSAGRAQPRSRGVAAQHKARTWLSLDLPENLMSAINPGFW